MDMNRQEWKEKAAEMSGVPKDVAMGLPILTITGTDELCVENYRGMTEYTDQIIRLQSKSADRLKSAAGNWKSSITLMMR